jgi:uncharacterized membrane protein
VAQNLDNNHTWLTIQVAVTLDTTMEEVVWSESKTLPAHRSYIESVGGSGECRHPAGSGVVISYWLHLHVEYDMSRIHDNDSLEGLKMAQHTHARHYYQVYK